MVVNVATMAKMVDFRRCAGYGNDAAERVKSVFSNRLSIDIEAPQDIAWTAVVYRTIIAQRIGLFVGREEEIQRSVTADCSPHCPPAVNILLGVATESHDPVAHKNRNMMISAMALRPFQCA